MFVRAQGDCGAELCEEQRGAQLWRERGGERGFLDCPLHCGVAAVPSLGHPRVCCPWQRGCFLCLGSRAQRSLPSSLLCSQLGSG